MDISIKTEACRFLNFAMQQNYVPPIYSIVVTNNSDEPAKDIILSVRAEPEFAPELNVNISLIEPHKSFEIRPVPFKATAEFMLSLTEKLSAQIIVESVCGGEMVSSDIIDIDLLAFDEWNGTSYIPEIISAFVTPNHPCISGIIAKAGEFLQKWAGDPSFTGYQTENPNNVRKQAAAIYAAIQSLNIAYCGAPASFESTGQRIRLANDVTSVKSATCLDLALLFASCLESVSINPIIVILNTHAFVGLWLENQTFAECTVDDVSSITKRLAAGINELCVIECTSVVAGRNISFEDAEKAAADKLSDTSGFEIAVDVKRCRGGGIRPLPLRVNEPDGRIIADYGERSKGDITTEPGNLIGDDRILEQTKTVISKQQLWERKLLDLSLRNPLLSFRATKNAIQIMISNITELEDRLASGESFTVMPQPTDWAKTCKDSDVFNAENDQSVISQIAESEFKNKRIRTFLSETELVKNCKALYRAAKLSLEENGSNTLYLALGFLRWYETDKSEKARYAPIVLVPIDIVRSVQEKSYKIRIRDEETQMNITLLELLRQDFGIDIAGLDPLPTDKSGADLQLVFNTVRRAVMNKKRWDMEPYAFIGLFSFSRFIMWNDLRNRSEDIAKNKVVASLISGKMEWQPTELTIPPEELDDRLMPTDIAVPASADSSQLTAVCAASAGQSFVLHGPPGTGKSQTITNMIANALSHGKSVLFVAEKMAALSVVQSRLEKIGLGPFCLELHSNKAQKRAVLSQLERALNVGKIKSPEDYSATAQKLFEQRSDLNGVMKALHKKRPCGMSLYEAISLYERYARHKGEIPPDDQSLSTLTPDSSQTRLEAVKRLQSAAGEFGVISKHTLKDYGRRDYSVTLREELSADLAKGEKLCEIFKASAIALCSALGISVCQSKTDCAELSVLSEMLCGSAVLMPGILSGTLSSQQHEYINDLFKKGEELSSLTNELSQQFDASVFTTDSQAAKLEWKKASSSWFLAKALGRSKQLKALKLHAKNADSITADSFPEIVDKLIRRSELMNTVQSADQTVTSAVSQVWLGEKTNWATAAEALKQNLSAAQILINHKISAERFVQAKGSGEVINYRSAYEEFSAFNDSFVNKFKVTENNDTWLTDCENRYGSWQLFTDKIKDWSALLRECDSVCGCGAPQVVSALWSGSVSGQELADSYLCHVGYSVAVKIISEEPELSSFTGRAFEDSIKRFDDITEKFRSLTINELVARLSANVPTVSGGMAGSSEIGILQRAIKNGGRMLPLRKLFDSIPLLLRKISPCMLMSPISVAQYIDPAYPKFDIVIFDEASQLPTSNAVGAIARGENVVVVGDPKQLPPTSFFSVNHIDEENYDKEDLESVLDDCLALSMPQMHLLWHYRSRHESLIAFSNSRFYDNKLYTFPSPNDLESRVTLVKVDGCYDKGGTKQNRAEAEAVVNEVVRRLDNEELRKESIGIVTFNIVQQALIDDMLADKFHERPELEQYAAEMHEPLLVKNLENVQGDERDVILFSIGYGPDKDGKVSMNFGPINRDGGWRRLNVAISRARKRMIVFSTITSDMIDLSRTAAEGVAGLKGFLEYAQKGSSVLTTRSQTVPRSENSIEKLIAEEINRAGFKTRCNIGCSEYKLDIGIIDPDDESKYILGVMCDGQTYADTKTANDRNLSQPSVLKGLGWNLIRVWTLDWFDNKQMVIDKILTAISDIQNGKCETIESAEARKTDIDVSGFEKETDIPKSEKVKPYITAKITQLGNSEALYNPQFKKRIESLMTEIIDTEAPISRRTLFKRTLSAFGMNRSTAKSDAYLSEICSGLGLMTTESNGNAFLWSEKVSPESISYFRQPGDTKRVIEDISAEEISCAVIYVLEQQLTLTRVDLTREAAKALGFTRTTPAIDSAVTEGIILCKKRGNISISPENGKISLC